MKIISPERRLWLIRVTEKRTTRHIKSKLKRKAILNIKSGESKSDNYNIRYYRLPGPTILTVSNQQRRKELLNWFKTLRAITLKKNQPVYIDFSNSRKPEAFGVILLLSEIDRIQNIKGKRFIKASKPNDNITNQVFHQVGLAKMLDLKQKPKITNEDVIYWNYIHGTRVEADKAGKQIVQIAKTYGLDDESLENLYGGVTEAITNTIMHAYTDKRGDGFPYGENKWWMFSGVKDGNLIVVVCDNGIGIPRSLKDTHPGIYQKFKELFVSEKDHELIQLAMEIGKTKSKEAHRGLGMVELKRFIDTAGEGRLKIMSNKGGYAYWSDGEEKTEDGFNFNDSIMGTVVGWRVPVKRLPEMQNNKNENFYD